MRRNNFGQNDNLLNAVNSPGERMLQNATDEELEQVREYADQLEADLNACKPK